MTSINDLHGMLRARSTTVGDWELFYLRRSANGWFNIQAADGNYVTSEVGGTGTFIGNNYGMLRSRTFGWNLGPWEQFTFSPPLSDDFFS